MSYFYCKNWQLCYYFVLLIFLHLVSAVKYLPKNNGPLRSGIYSYIHNFSNRLSPLEIRREEKRARSFENMAVRRHLPYKDMEDIKRLFNKNGIMYLPRPPDSIQGQDLYGIDKQDKYRIKTYSSNRKDRRKKENAIRVLLLQAERRIGGDKPKIEFEFSELVS